MSAITIDNELVHYEVLGRGRPVILLHGWLGSWRYWVPAMQQLSMKFRTYALDFWGFGDSGKGTGRYGFDQQVKLLEMFISELGIQKVALIGHGLGAAVATAYALKYPDRVPRLMVVSPPLFRMAPNSIPLTFNAPPAKQLPAGAQPSSHGTSGSVPAPPTPALDTSPPSTPTPTQDTSPTPAPTPSQDTVPPSTPISSQDASPTPAPDTTPTSSQGPAPAGAKTDASSGETPASQPEEKPDETSDPKPDQKAVQPAADTTVPDTEAPTMPVKPDDLKAAIKAEMERRAKEIGEQIMAEKLGEAKGLAPKDAATPPADKPAREITTAEMKTLPQQIAEAAARKAAEGEIQAANPLLDHLGTLNRVELLKKHVDAGPDLEKLRAEVDKADPEALVKSIESLAQVNTLADLQRLTMPCVAVYGSKDTFLPPPDDQMLASLKSGLNVFRAVRMEGNRHFPMLENIPGFARLLVDFLSASTAEITSLDIKETWERRVR
jgi:pimeloyl-ACP methyl ester carboxylesterase